MLDSRFRTNSVSGADKRVNRTWHQVLVKFSGMKHWRKRKWEAMHRKIDSHVERERERERTGGKRVYKVLFRVKKRLSDSPSFIRSGIPLYTRPSLPLVVNCTAGTPNFGVKYKLFPLTVSCYSKRRRVSQTSWKTERRESKLSCKSMTFFLSKRNKKRN